MIDHSYERLRKLLRKELRYIKRFGTTPRYDTSDILQEACLQIHRDYTKDSGIEELPGSLLKKIVLGHLAKQHRFHRSKKRSEKKEETSSSEMVSRNDDPQKIVELSELTTIVMQAMERLDPREQDVVRSRLLNDATYAEIAKRLDTTIPIVKRIYRSAYAKIKAECQ